MSSSTARISVAPSVIFEYTDEKTHRKTGGTDTITKLEMPSMKKVVRLNLDYNRYLKSVSGFSQLPALRELDIRHTQLDNLDEIGKCTRLRKLNAGGLLFSHISVCAE